MYNYEGLAADVQQRQAEMLRQAEQARLAAVAQDQNNRGFRIIGWRLPALRLGLFNLRPTSARKVSRRTVADNV